MAGASGKPIRLPSIALRLYLRAEDRSLDTPGQIAPGRKAGDPGAEGAVARRRHRGQAHNGARLLERAKTEPDTVKSANLNRREIEAEEAKKAKRPKAGKKSAELARMLLHSSTQARLPKLGTKAC
jgi:hypothetical protein